MTEQSLSPRKKRKIESEHRTEDAKRRLIDPGHNLRDQSQPITPPASSSSTSPPEDRLLELALCENWSEFSMATCLTPPPPLKDSRVPHGVHQGKNLLSLLVYHNQWRMLDILISVYNLSEIIEQPIYSSDSEKFDPGKNFLWLLTVNGQWYLLRRLLANPQQLSNKAVASQAEKGLKQGTNMLWHLAFWNRAPEIRSLINQRKIDSSALSSQAITGIAQGKNVLGLLIAYQQWDIIEQLVDQDLINHPSLIANSKFLLRLAQEERWQFIEKLISKELVTSDELAEREYGANVLLHIAAQDNHLPIIHRLLEKELITAEQLTAVGQRGDSIYERGVLDLVVDRAEDTAALVSKFLEIKSISKKALVVDGTDIDVPARLVAAYQFSNIEKLIDLDLLTCDMLGSIAVELTYKQQWKIVKKLIDKDLLSAKLMELSGSSRARGEESAADILWLLAKNQQWDLIADLINKRLITSAVLKKPPINHKTFWDFLDIPTEGGAAETEEDQVIADKKMLILEALIQQGLVDSEVLLIKLATAENLSLLRLIFWRYFDNAAIRSLLIPQITTQLLIESTLKRNESEYGSPQHYRSFLTDALRDSRSNVSELIALLLDAPLQPLAGVPWKSFRQLTSRLMAWCWQQRGQNNLFTRLVALGVSQPTNTELGWLLNEKEQLAWLRQGGPEITLEHFPKAEQFAIKEGLIFEEVPGLFQKKNAEALMEKVIYSASKTVADLPKIALLKFAGPAALAFLNKYRLPLPPLTEVAPNMSETCVYSWLLKGDLNLFEEYFLADLPVGAPLPSQEAMKDLWRYELAPARRIKINALYKKYAASQLMSIEALGPTITDFSVRDQDIYWQDQIQKKITDLLVNFAFRMADMPAYGFSNVIANIIFSYLLSDVEEIIPHCLLDKGLQGLPTTVAAMSQSLVVKEQYRGLMSQANREAEYLYAKITPCNTPELLALLGHKFERKKISESSTTRSEWRATRTGNNSAFHAIFGVWDEESREYVCKNITLQRQGLKCPNDLFNALNEGSGDPLDWALKNSLEIRGDLLDKLREDYKNWQQRIETAWLKLETLLKKNQQAMHYLEAHWNLPKAYSPFDDRPKLREIVKKMSEQAGLRQEMLFKKILDSDRKLKSSFIDYIEFLYVDYLDLEQHTDKNGYYQEYVLALRHLDRNLLPHELFFVAHSYGLHIICHLPGGETLAFNDSSADIVEIWYDGRHFFREPQPDSRHLYQASALPQVLPTPSSPLAPSPRPEVPGKDEKSPSTAAWKPTVADGNCAFHAIFGEGNGRFYYCIDAQDKRGKLAKAIADCFPVESSSSSSSSSSSKDEHKTASMVYRLSITGITALIMDQQRPLTGKLRGLHMIYQHWCEQRNELDLAWAALEIALKGNPHALNFLATQHTLDQLAGLTDSQVLRAQLQNICQQPTLVADLQQIIAQDPALQSSYQTYQQQQSRNQDFDWRAAISIDILQEYADIISQPGRYLLPAELEIIAYVFNRKIIFYPHYAANPQVFNDEGFPAVEVWFNGRNHFEREPEVQSIGSKSKKTKRAREETEEVAGRGKLAKTATSSFTTPVQSISSTLLPVKALSQKPPLPRQGYVGLLALIMSGQEQEAVKINNENAIDYKLLLHIAESSSRISDYFPLFSFLANFVNAREIHSLFSRISPGELVNISLFFHLAKNEYWELIIHLIPAAKFLINPEHMRHLTALLLEAEISSAVLGAWQAIAKTFIYKETITAFDFERNSQKSTSRLGRALLEAGAFQTFIFFTQTAKIIALPSFLEINEALFKIVPEDAEEFFVSGLFEIYNQTHYQASPSPSSAAVLSGPGLFGSQGSFTFFMPHNWPGGSLAPLFSSEFSPPIVRSK